jgi:NAD(P)-dependent dehydrogenase (short-subunit alcohol dehydrogenase family)
MPIAKSSNMNKKTVVITGASSGLGKATALAFARKGWWVAVADINQERGDETVEEIKALGSQAFFKHCNVANSEDIQALHDRCLEEWTQIDVLINNAGIVSALGTIDRVPMVEWQRAMDINLMGVVRGCSIFTRTFKEQGGGHIVNIASIAGLITIPTMTSYSASKAAVVSLSEMLRAELKHKNIGVTVVCPSLFRTNLSESLMNAKEGQQEVIDREMEKSTVTADDIAEKIVTAVKNNQFMLLPHKTSWLHWGLKRLSPNLYQWVITRK